MPSPSVCRVCGTPLPRSVRPGERCPDCKQPYRPRLTRRSRLPLAAALAALLGAGAVASRLLVSSSAGAPESTPVASPPSAPGEAVKTDVAAAVNVSPEDRPSPDREEPAVDSAHLETESPPPAPAPAAPVRAAAAPAAVAPPAKPAVQVVKNQPPAATFNRRDLETEADLLAVLARAPEVGVRGSGQAVASAYFRTRNEQGSVGIEVRPTDPTPLLSRRSDLRQLPYRSGPGTQISPRQGHTLYDLGRKLRAYLLVAAPPNAEGRHEVTPALRARMLSEMHGKRPEWLRAEAIPAMLQLLMPEDASGRRLLIDLLAEIDGKVSTEALARRAVFDLDADNRQAAVAALRPRPADDYRQILVKALRYPWAPAAEHAAEALGALGDRQAVPELVTLLTQPDPAAPAPGPGGRLFVREIVRANHQANCVLCHPPSMTGNDSVIGIDPVLVTPPSARGSGGGGYGRSPVLFGGGSRQTPATSLVIRADVTFLRQDFSSLLAVAPGAGGAAPARLRFDYVVRTRYLTKKDRAQPLISTGEDPDHPQRQAVLFALRELTGRDAGTTTVAWQKLYPQADAEVEAARLGRDFVKADPLRQEALLDQLRDGKRPAHTLALAHVIPGLQGKRQETARDYLATRLARLPEDDLLDKLRDADPEIRRSAEVAFARKKSSAATEGTENTEK